jgi:hypothetical protein
MTMREALKAELDIFSDEEVQQVADFMAFLKFRTQVTSQTLPEDTPKEQVLANFRQAWHEAMTGQGVPVAQLWTELENE